MQAPRAENELAFKNLSVDTLDIAAERYSDVEGAISWEKCMSKKRRFRVFGPFLGEIDVDVYTIVC